MSMTRREAARLIGTLAVSGTWLQGACSATARRPRPTLAIGINGGDEGKSIKELSTRYTGAEIETTELSYTSLREKLQTSLDASPYDLVMLDDPWFPELADYLRPLEGVSASLLADIIPASLALGHHTDGSLRSLPFVGNCQLLFYRQDLLADVGISSPPTTWTRVLEVAGKIRDRTRAKVSGYCIRGKSGAPLVSDFLPVLWSHGGSVFADSTIPSAKNVTIGASETVEALQTYRDLLRFSPPGALSFDWNEMTVAFTNGTAAMELNWPFAARQLEDSIARSVDGSRRWGITLPPGSNGPGTSMAGNWLLGVPKSAKHPEAAQEFLLWLMEHQKEAAIAGNPPTRTSVFADAELAGRPEFFFFRTLLEALERSTARPRTARWARVEDVIAQSVSSCLAGSVEPATAASRMQQQIVAVMVAPR